jgi:ATP-dependent RNA circularization protein (DNA/RNA ligase family)
MSLLNEIMNKYGVDKLNSLTKYPSIFTYHSLGEKGSLTETLVDDRDFALHDKCYISEKIDGTNARIIVTNGDYIIGSREELLFSKGDRFGNPQLNIVNTVKGIAERLSSSEFNGIYTLYGEVYGGNVTKASRQYTSDKTYGFRVFDFAEISTTILSEPLEKISAWREHGGQAFWGVDALMDISKRHGLETVPYLAEVNGNTIPKDRIAMFTFLQNFSETKAGINHNGQSEGIVVRNYDRSLIRKIRFEDYERTAKREKWDV